MFFGKRMTPNPIDTLSIPNIPGVLGLSGCPGTRIHAELKLPARVLLGDLDAIENWGANGVCCLLEPQELDWLGVPQLPDQVLERRLWWKHLPIRDMGVPNQRFEDDWAIEGERIRDALRNGQKVVLHCYAGLGRTGMIAARLLVEFGMDPEAAVQQVRATNRRRIQTQEQQAFVHYCAAQRG